MNDFSNYYVSYTTGFIINQNEEIEIPNYYEPWLYIKRNLEELIRSDLLTTMVNNMPLLSILYLASNEQLRYSHCILAFITSGYIWHKRETQVPKMLPKGLAVPFLKISNMLGLMPILSHADIIICNTIVNESKPYFHRSAVESKEKLFSNRNWNIFQRETARVELCFAPVIKAIKALNECILENKPNHAISHLENIGSTIIKMSGAMKGFDDMDPDYFHSEIRPYLVGWSGNSFFKDACLFFENEDGSTTPIECIGSSAAQSPTLQVLDALFKINHCLDSQRFLDTMRQYMLRQHREFIEDLREYVNLPGFVTRHKTNRNLLNSYKKCIENIAYYRTTHMATVSKFILNPIKRKTQCEKHFQFLQERGTGGQDLLEFLKGVRNDTRDSIDENNHLNEHR